jgi:hypothetical protein
MRIHDATNFVEPATRPTSLFSKLLFSKLLCAGNGVFVSRWLSEVEARWLSEVEARALIAAVLLALAQQATTAQAAELLAAAKTPTAKFPATSNPRVHAQAFDLAGLELRDFAIAPDRKAVFALLRRRDANGQLRVEMRVFDADAQLLRKRALADVAASDEAELFFTDQGTLVWNDFKYFRLIAPNSLEFQAFPQCRATAYPLLQAHQTQAAAAASTWRAAKMQQLNQQFALKPEEIKVGNPNIVPEFWSSYRQINADAELKSAEFAVAAYEKMLASFAAQAAPEVGIIIENAYATAHYARLRVEGHDWYCDFGRMANQYAVQWQRIAIAPGSKSARALAPLSVEQDRLQQDGLQLRVLARRKTSSYAQELVGRMQFDTEIEVSSGAASYRFMLLSQSLQLARDHAVALANGTLVIRYLGGLYRLPSP